MKIVLLLRRSTGFSNEKLQNPGRPHSRSIGDGSRNRCSFTCTLLILEAQHGTTLLQILFGVFGHKTIATNMQCDFIARGSWQPCPKRSPHGHFRRRTPECSAMHAHRGRYGILGRVLVYFVSQIDGMHCTKYF